jgi:hypothetical protein
MPHRVAPAWDAKTLAEIVGSEYSPVVSLTLAENPPAYRDRIYRISETCPLCGQTLRVPRVAASIYPMMDLGPKFGIRSGLGFGVWIHSACLEVCPLTNEPTPIPW